jgi:hypothetical protein
LIEELVASLESLETNENFSSDVRKIFENRSNATIMVTKTALNMHPNLQTVIEGLNISRNAVLGNVSAMDLEENRDVIQKLWIIISNLLTRWQGLFLMLGRFMTGF